MRIPTSKLAPTAPPSHLPSKDQLLNNLRPGQLLQARALSENSNGNVRLQIGDAKLTAQTQLAVRPGQTLLLQVEKTTPLPELKLLTLPSQKQLQASALRQVLPRQQALSGLFDKLAQSIAADQGKSLPPSLRQEIHAFLGRLLSAENAGLGQQLKDALTQSGILSEAQLMHGRITGNDMKLGLLQLATVTESLLSQQKPSMGQSSGSQGSSNLLPTGLGAQDLLSDLHKQLDSALARVQLNQLCSLPQDDPARQIWQFELPMRQGDRVDLLKFRVKREGTSPSDESAESWSLALVMNLTPLGPMRIQLRLHDDQISAVLWSQNASTTQLVSERLPELQGSFERAGLQVKRVAAFTGTVEEENWIPRDVSLLDERA